MCILPLDAWWIMIFPCAAAADWELKMNDEPLAFFLTWTVYGTFLQGDERGWRKRSSDYLNPQPYLRNWHVGRLNHPIILMNPDQRDAINSEISRLCEYREWRLWKANARSNHVHSVVTANGFAGNIVRDQLKANCTRVLREKWPEFRGRPVWTKNGDWQCINNEEDLEQVIRYVGEAQDLRGIDDT